MALRASYARVYVDDLDTALPTFQALTGTDPAMRFTYLDLELAGIGPFLLIAGTPEALAPFRATHATVTVDSIDEVTELVAREGGEVVDGPNEVPTGHNMTVRHPGGSLIEYVAFDPVKAAALSA